MKYNANQQHLFSGLVVKSAKHREKNLCQYTDNMLSRIGFSVSKINNYTTTHFRIARGVNYSMRITLINKFFVMILNYFTNPAICGALDYLHLTKQLKPIGLFTPSIICKETLYGNIS